ncbi:MAG: right-handed parallel beta-helix repeat-containing protein [Planctomycetes bacterium]|nr:right-handed parallel beta-helix repeat-containing protein [Planctomycetota bacterium]
MKCILLLAAPLWMLAMPCLAVEKIGADKSAGCLAQPREVERLEIAQPGVYENYLVDSHWQGGNRVKITADNVTLRHCEIRNATGNGVGVFGKHVTIESCRIHHLLNGTYAKQDDAHGVTGRPEHLVIRNCDISYVSGDAVQFNPDRTPWDDVLIEHCTFWTGPLPADAGNFKAGERPGENAFDSKTPASGKRSRIVFRDCLFHGWNQPAQINLMAAMNLKENVDALLERCVFRDNQVSLRLRGPGRNGGARVTVRDCAIYQSAVGVRMEDKLEGLRLERVAFGSDVERRFHQLDKASAPSFENIGEADAPPLEQLIRDGFRK